MSRHNVLLTEGLVAMRAGIAIVLGDQRASHQTPAHLCKSSLGIKNLLLFSFLGEGVLKWDELDGVFDDRGTLEFHQVLDAEARLLHSLFLLLLLRICKEEAILQSYQPDFSNLNVFTRFGTRFNTISASEIVNNWQNVLIYLMRLLLTRNVIWMYAMLASNWGLRVSLYIWFEFQV